MRRRLAVLLMFAVLTPYAAGCTTSGTGSDEQGSCVSPRLAVQPITAAPGATVHVTGQWFLATCGDVLINGASATQGQPLGQLTLVLTDAAGAQHQVGVARPDDAGTISLDLTLPSDVATGPALLAVSGHGLPAQLDIR